MYHHAVQYVGLVNRCTTYYTYRVVDVLAVATTHQVDVIVLRLTFPFLQQHVDVVVVAVRSLTGAVGGGTQPRL